MNDRDQSSSAAAGGGRMAGRRILITGAASGIGAAAARLLRREGASVALLDVSADKLQAIARELAAPSWNVDLADAAAVGPAVVAAAGALDGLDGVVNAAGVGVIADFADTDESTWRRAMSVNLDGPYRVCHGALPFLLQAGTGATIVNVSSAVALQPFVRRTAYAASKSGLLAFTKVLAMELAPTVRANAILPGAIDTPMVSGSFSRETMQSLAERYALKRLGTAEEVANAILFLSSDESSFITGSALSVDGGRIYH
ncbi:MAG: SDR family NAD(P)-dependent oxidoreductase [Burkholderiaceae bacterium]